MSVLRGMAFGRPQDTVSSSVAAAESRRDVLLADDSASSLPWYVVHTKVRQEQTACDNLDRQGYAVYLPRIKILKRIRGQLRAQQEPLFPRYLFIQPGKADQSIAPVRSTLGVATIVRFGQEPAVIRAETIMSIQDFEARRNAARDEDLSPFQPGKRVRIAAGPLIGFEGLISCVSQERVIVLMQLLGQDTRVSLSQHQLLIAH